MIAVSTAPAATPVQAAQRPARASDRDSFDHAIRQASDQPDDKPDEHTGKDDDKAADAASPAQASVAPAPAPAPAADPSALAGLQAMIAAIAGNTLPAKADSAASAGEVRALGKAGAGKLATTDASAATDGDTPDLLSPDIGAVFADAQRALAAATPTAGDSTAPGSVTVDAGAPVDATITHHLDLAKDGAWLDQLARDITRSADAGGHLRFALAPEHLGRMTVELASGADGTAIRLTTETREAHRIVADAQPQLVAEARAQGLRVSDTSVDLDNRQSGQQQSFGNQNSGGGGGEPRPQQPWRPSPVASAPAAAATAAAGSDDELYA